MKIKQEKEIKNKRDEINKQKEEIDNKEKELKKREYLIKNKEEEMNSREEKIKKKEEELNKKEKEIKHNKEVMHCKEEEIKKLNEQMKNEKELKKQLEELEKYNLEKYKKIINLKDNENKIIQDYDKELKEKQKENEVIKKDLLNKENEIKELNNKNENIKLDYENKINSLISNLIEKKNKIDKLEKELKSKNEILNKNENDYKIKIKEYENKIREIDYNEELLKLISEKEKEINNKMSFLEVKKNLIEKESKKFENDKKENIRIEQENSNLIAIRNKLIKEIEEKQKIYNQILLNIEETKKKQQNLMDVDSKALIGYIDKNNNLFKSMNENQKLSIINEYEEEPILVGLNNIGATYFMNSVLQCLSQTKPLTDYFLNDRNFDRIINNNIEINNNKEKKNELQLSPVYYELINQLWDKKGNKSFSPNNFMNQVEKMNPLFKQGQAGDSKDFIIFIFEQLHKELKSPVPGVNQGNIQPLNQYDKNNSFNHFFNEFKKDCSIISDIFFGFNETTNECLNCKAIYSSQGYNHPICYNYGLFNCLIFPLEEVKKMKYNNIQNNQNNIVSIYECFYYNQKSEVFTGQNRNYCNNCKQVYDSIYTSKIFIGPNILVLILNRGKGNIYDVKLQFSEKINITQYVLQRDKPQLIYNLYGVITHIGQSGPNAHFVASCKSSINNRWYRFNDAIINPIANVQKEVIGFGTPYILFYQKQ